MENCADRSGRPSSSLARTGSLPPLARRTLWNSRRSATSISWRQSHGQGCSDSRRQPIADLEDYPDGKQTEGERPTRRYVRVAGPFDGCHLGRDEEPVLIYDLNLGGGFVNFLHEQPQESTLALKIELPHEAPDYGARRNGVSPPVRVGRSFRRRRPGDEGSSGPHRRVGAEVRHALTTVGKELKGVHSTRRYARVAGPFDGCQLGLPNTPVLIYDLNLGGGFVTFHSRGADGGEVSAENRSAFGRPVTINAETVYRHEFGVAVRFVDVDADTAARLERTVVAMQHQQRGNS